jgi:acetyltransferase-like isoleucine patch superfamily enzyme
MSFISRKMFSFYLKLCLIISPERFARELGLRFGNGCRFISINRETFGSEPYLIQLGDQVSISSGVRFVNHDGGVWVLRHMYKNLEQIDLFKRIVIGNNVFIGLNVIILPGVHIGDNCIIGAGAIVTKSFENNSILAGIPARKISDVADYLSNQQDRFMYTKNLTAFQKKAYLEENLIDISEKD